MERQLATDPDIAVEVAALRSDIEDAHEAVRHRQPSFVGGSLVPSREFSAPPIEGSGREASRRHRQQAASREEIAAWQDQEQRLAAIRALRGRADAAALLPDPGPEIASIRHELSRLSGGIHG
jgi:hypothetical protein